MTFENRVLVMTDYRGGFWSSTRNVQTATTMDVDRLSEALRISGLDVVVLPAARALSEMGDTPSYVVYTSSEHAESYKRFIEATVLGLQCRGHTPIPRFEYLLAHHSKAVMESIRGGIFGEDAGNPSARVFGALEELDAEHLRYPVVLKPSRGAGSRGVTLAKDAEEARRSAEELSRSEGPKERLLSVLRAKRRPDFVPPSSHQNPFVVQPYISGLSGDYKVLRYGSRLYVVGRRNREGDFRASGAGLLDYRIGDGEDLAPVLDAAWTWATKLQSPFSSLDVAYSASSNGGHPMLIEFQCVMFGPAALENSVGYYTGGPGAWQFTKEKSVLESVFAQACVGFIRADQGA
ncbi:hypothetical protein [Ornithinimicrobium cerasi]|uniref:hypothetical protein n=1 Tax=Ornithinimicrobium cerasi TaxID=2248773 RepID=UPI000EFE2D2B|nr:hypothetical protein [Ornithinimicrobium cerasi]